MTRPCFHNTFLLLLLVIHAVAAFHPPLPVSHATVLSSSTTTTATTEQIPPKELVKLFGRLADKYILLDDSAGMCCYSACTDCEFRLPGGGYRMADQSAARPKWIPIYGYRKGVKEHESVWRMALFANDNDENVTLTKQHFCDKLIELPYTPPLGGRTWVRRRRQCKTGRLRSDCLMFWPMEKRVYRKT